MTETDATVSDLGEAALLVRIGARLKPLAEGEVGPGDDAALVRSPGDSVVVTTDVLVEGIDFDLAYATGEDIGWKALAVNVSDVAAMGARPTHAVATLGLRPDTPLGLFDAILDGLLAAGERWATALVGGDLSEAGELTLSVAMLGAVLGEDPVLRSGSRPGDALCVTGTLGGAAGGLHALRSGLSRTGDARGLMERQLRPQARAAEGAYLAADATAMIDISDGLAVDLHRLLEAGGTGADVDETAIPIDPALALLDGIDPLDLALTGGEDFELLFCLPPDRVSGVSAGLAELGAGCTRIGEITSGGAHVGKKDLSFYLERSWEHLRNR